MYMYRNAYTCIFVSWVVELIKIYIIMTSLLTTIGNKSYVLLGLIVATLLVRRRSFVKTDSCDKRSSSSSSFYTLCKTRKYFDTHTDTPHRHTS